MCSATNNYRMLVAASSYPIVNNVKCRHCAAHMYCIIAVNSNLSVTGNISCLFLWLNYIHCKLFNYYEVGMPHIHQYLSPDAHISAQAPHVKLPQYTRIYNFDSCACVTVNSTKIMALICQLTSAVTPCTAVREPVHHVVYLAAVHWTPALQ